MENGTLDAYLRTTTLSNLCPSCFDLQETFSQSKGFLDRLPVLRNGHSGCVLCQFFHSIKWESTKDEGLQSTDTYDLVKGPYRYKTLRCFAIIPSSFPDKVLWADLWKDFKTKRRIFFVEGNPKEHDQPGIYGRILQPTIDFQQIRSWLMFCNHNHTKFCPTNAAVPSKLIVIDCISRQITTLDETLEPYVTLSYVWGNPLSASNYRPDGQPRTFERTIENSILVVILLGFRYLWVDRYCIPQDDPLERHSQLLQMGDIYANSTLTIVAAAGSGSESGLPGVSSTIRNIYPHLRTESLFLVAVPPTAKEEVLNSVWNTRGWTYQEGLLSRRRLVFTESQVYFQCKSMHCEESVNIPLDTVHIKSLERYPDTLKPEVFPRYGIGKTSEELIDRITEFASRQFTYPSDTLDAFQGILDAFQLLKNPVLHVCGVPIFSQKDLKKSSNFSVTEMFLSGLSWKTNGPSTRRPGFPSWSWLGWQFEGFHLQLDLRLKSKEQRSLLVSLEAESESIILHLLEKAGCSSAYKFGENKFPPLLNIRGWVHALDSSRNYVLPQLFISAYRDIVPGTRPIRRSDELHRFISQAFYAAGMSISAETPSSCPLVLFFFGKEDPLTFWTFILRYNESLQAYERLPYPCMFFSSEFNFKSDGTGHVGSLRLEQLQLSLT